MKVSVTAVSKFQKYFPARTSEVDFAGGTLAEFLDLVQERYGLDVNDHKNIKITRNHKLVRDFDVRLEDGDRIGFIPIVAGG